MMPNENVLIDIHNLGVQKSGREICRVGSLSVSRGGRVAIHGANGSGKTTLLRVVARLESDFSGRCEIRSHVRDRVFVHQSPYMFRGTVVANVTYGIRARGLHRTTSQVDEWLTLFGLDELRERRARDLSGGEQRRVALARAMVLEPELLLLDEPLSDLDKPGEDALRVAIERLPNSTVLVASPLEFGRELGFAEFRMP